MTRVLLLLPLWLVFAVGEPSLVHQCPMHDAAAQHGGRATRPGGTHAGHTPAPAVPASHHGCSCIGSCITGAAVVVPVTGTVPAAVVVLRDPRAPSTPLLTARFEPQRLLPFANGPPALRG